MSKFAPAMAMFLIAGPLSAADGDALNRAIQAARDDPDMPFELRVYCSIEQSRRSLSIFRGAVGVWNGEHQVMLGSDDRRAVLELLLDSGFGDFEARYGEQKKADKQEAPLRITCRVHLQIADHEKTAIQLLEGEQSPELLGLATSLLDQIEPLSADGVTASSLEDGLAKLANGALAPEVLELRLLSLPENASSGVIVRIRGGTISRQAYAPGSLVGDVDTRDLDACVMHEVVSALMEAKAWDLPRNLSHDGTTELDVSVLATRKSLLARSTFGAVNADIQARFERLVERIEAPACQENL